MATLHTRGVGGRGLITPCPRFVGCRCGDVEERGREREPLPGVSCIGDRLWGRRCSKGGRVNRTLHVLKGPCRRNFQRWKKSHVNFHRPNLHRYSVGQVFPRFIRFFFFFFFPRSDSNGVRSSVSYGTTRRPKITKSLEQLDFRSRGFRLDF